MTLLHLTSQLPEEKDIWILMSEIAAPTTLLGVYPWDLPPVPESSTSLTKTSSPGGSLSTLSSWEFQPDIPTLQPSYDVSYMGSVLNLSSTRPSSTVTSVTPTSTPQPVTLTTSSVFSLISLIPGPTGPVNASATSTTATAPHPSCSDKSPFTIGVSRPVLSLSLWV